MLRCLPGPRRRRRGRQKRAHRASRRSSCKVRQDLPASVGKRACADPWPAPSRAAGFRPAARRPDHQPYRRRHQSGLRPLEFWHNSSWSAPVRACRRSRRDWRIQPAARARQKESAMLGSAFSCTDMFPIFVCTSQDADRFFHIVCTKQAHRFRQIVKTCSRKCDCRTSFWFRMR